MVLPRHLPSCIDSVSRECFNVKFFFSDFCIFLLSERACFSFLKLSVMSCPISFELVAIVLIVLSLDLKVNFTLTFISGFDPVYHNSKLYLMLC